MSAHEPHAWATAAVRLATSILPHGPVQQRYRDELIAELWGMSTWQQLGHAVSTLVGASSLRRALYAAGELEFPHSPWWCRMRLHHRLHRATNEDGTRYRRCLACGMDDDETSRRWLPGAIISARGDAG